MIVQDVLIATLLQVTEKQELHSKLQSSEKEVRSLRSSVTQGAKQLKASEKVAETLKQEVARLKEENQHLRKVGNDSGCILSMASLKDDNR